MESLSTIVAQSMSDSKSAVSIIIPTLASVQRQAQLNRAVESALTSSRLTPSVIICVNGSRWSEQVLEGLAGFGPHVHVLRQQVASAPLAVGLGRRHVQTPFFACLDDDDELLSGSIDRRLQVFADSPEADFVVTNGLRRSRGLEEAMLSDLANVPLDPIQSLFKQNWLASCGALFRTSSVHQKYFDDCHPFAEWTWLAYRLCLDGKRIAVLDEPTFVVNDTPGSVSKTRDYRASYLDLYRRMLLCDPPASVRRLVIRRFSAAWHDISEDYLREGRLLHAFSAHMRSVTSRGGLRYLSFTRHILYSAMRKLRIKPTAR